MFYQSELLLFFRRLGGESAPLEWQGGFSELDYKLGPLFNAANQKVSLTLSTHNRGKIEESFNVIGVIKGFIEPGEQNCHL